MPRRSRYPAGKGNQQSSRRRSSNIGKRPTVRPSTSVASRQVAPSMSIPNTPIASEPIESTLPPPPYLIRELKRTLIIAGVMILILAILSIIL